MFKDEQKKWADILTLEKCINTTHISINKIIIKKGSNPLFQSSFIIKTNIHTGKQIFDNLKAENTYIKGNKNKLEDIEHHKK